MYQEVRSTRCEKKKTHHGELFNLNSKYCLKLSTSLCVPALSPSFSLSLLLSVFLLVSLSKIHPAVKTVRSWKLWKSAVYGDKPQFLGMKSAHYDLMVLQLCCCSVSLLTGQQRQNRRDHCSLHALQQDLCRVSVCVWSIQSHNLTFSCSSEYLHMESIKGYWIDMQKHIGFKFKYSNVHARYD